MKLFRMELTPPLAAIGAALMLPLAGFCGFKYQTTLTVQGYSKSSTLQNFPVLVRISPARISGFAYSQLQEDGKDIAFFSLDGATRFPHEIDTWNAEGESLVWVNVASLAAGTQFLMQYGDELMTVAPDGAETWAQADGGFYGGVWHFGDAVSAAGTEVAADSAKHLDSLNMDATPAKGAEGDLKQMQPCTGAIGLGRVNGERQGSTKGNGFVVKNYNDLGMGDTFTMSIWYHTDFEIAADVEPGILFRRKSAYYDAGGFLLSIRANGKFSARRGYTSEFQGTISPDFSNAWVHVAFASRGDDIVVYTNGVAAFRNSNATANTHCLDNGQSLCFGYTADYRPCFCGAFDEARLCSSGTSDDWIAAEYATVADADFLSAAAVESRGDMLFVTAEPEELGEPNPGYGWTKGASGTIVATAPAGEIILSDQLRVRFDGWARYVEGGAGWDFVTEGPGTECTYGHTAGAIDKIVWKLVRRHPLTLKLDNAAAGGSFLVNGVAASAGVVWVDESEDVTIQAVAPENVQFERWSSGPVVSRDAAVTTLPVFGPVTVSAVFSASSDPTHMPTTCVLKPTGTDYLSPASWADGAVPSFGDTVYLTNKTAVTVSLGAGYKLPHLAKLVVGGKTTLVLSNWFTRVSADVIEVKDTAVITCKGPYTDDVMSNRVWLAGGSLTVAAGASIHANQRGYAAGCGPAWKTAATPQTGNCIVSYGAGNATLKEYGSAEWPLDPGSGNQNWGHPGGGAICLEFTGDVVINGTVAAMGEQGTHGYTYRGGSGGGIAIACRTISGTGSVMANAQPVEMYNYGPQYASHGGRVAVHYNPAAQLTTSCRVAFQARGGMAAAASSKKTMGGVPSVGKDPNEPTVAACGTLWFPDNQLLTEPIHTAGGLRLAGRWAGPVPLTELVVAGDYALTNCWLTLPATLERISIGGNLEIVGTGTTAYSGLTGGLVLSSPAEMTVAGDLAIRNSRLELDAGGSVSVGGNLLMITNSVPHANLVNQAGPHLVIHPTPGEGVGARIDVAKSWVLSNLSFVYPWCDPTTGSYVAMTAKNLVMDEGATICADGCGFAPGYGPGIPALTDAKVGAAHGGRGAAIDASTSNKLCEAYGDYKMPCEAGSGGNISSGLGVPGGGVVHLTVAKNAVINGTISANAATNVASNPSSGASGGTVYLSARKLYGETPSFSAVGGSAKGPVGGGGRIAIYCIDNFFSAPVPTDVRCGPYQWYTGSYNYYQNPGAGEPGTVYWGDLPCPGLMLLVR